MLNDFFVCYNSFIGINVFRRNICPAITFDISYGIFLSFVFTQQCFSIGFMSRYNFTCLPKLIVCVEDVDVVDFVLYSHPGGSLGINKKRIVTKGNIADTKNVIITSAQSQS